MEAGRKARARLPRSAVILVLVVALAVCHPARTALRKSPATALLQERAGVTKNLGANLFRLDKKLGAGNFGSVWRGEVVERGDEGAGLPDGPVAIKDATYDSMLHELNIMDYVEREKELSPKCATAARSIVDYYGFFFPPKNRMMEPVMVEPEGYADMDMYARWRVKITEVKGEFLLKSEPKAESPAASERDLHGLVDEAQERERNGKEDHVCGVYSFADHGTLSTEIKRVEHQGEFRKWSAFLRYVAEVLDALHCLSEGLGVIHNDVKEDNILVKGGKGGPHAVLADFGQARHITPKLIEELVRKRRVEVCEILEGATIGEDCREKLSEELDEEQKKIFQHVGDPTRTTPEELYTEVWHKSAHGTEYMMMFARRLGVSGEDELSTEEAIAMAKRLLRHTAYILDFGPAPSDPALEATAMPSNFVLYPRPRLAAKDMWALGLVLFTSLGGGSMGSIAYAWEPGQEGSRLEAIDTCGLENWDWAYKMDKYDWDKPCRQPKHVPFKASGLEKKVDLSITRILGRLPWDPVLDHDIIRTRLITSGEQFVRQAKKLVEQTLDYNPLTRATPEEALVTLRDVQKALHALQHPTPKELEALTGPLELEGETWEELLGFHER